MADEKKPEAATPKANPAATVRTALAETWAWYFETISFHWNVTGRDFPQLHDLFRTFYWDAQGAVDGLAEQLRALDEFAPSSLAEIDEGSKITFADKPPDSQAMVKKLAGDNEIVLGALDAAQHAASDADQQGLANYLQDRINTHRKWGWMLKATASEAGVKDIAAQKKGPGSERLGKLLGAIKPEPKAVEEAEDEAPADGEGA